jgi:hypothetical protein
MGSVQDEHHIFVRYALRWHQSESEFFSVVSLTIDSAMCRKCSEVDRNSDHDWRLVLRGTCRYLELVGGIFKPIHMADPQAAGNVAELELDDSDE